jgi:hypothetical protein
MNTSPNKYDAVESLIFEEGLRVQAITFYKELNLMLIVLNTKAVLRQKISFFPKLYNASVEQLQQYELIANGTGVHWPALDEDLSLKGFLREELRCVVNKGSQAA